MSLGKCDVIFICSFLGLHFHVPWFQLLMRVYSHMCNISSKHRLLLIPLEVDLFRASIDLGQVDIINSKTQYQSLVASALLQTHPCVFPRPPQIDPAPM